MATECAALLHNLPEAVQSASEEEGGSEDRKEAQDSAPRGQGAHAPYRNEEEMSDEEPAAPALPEPPPPQETPPPDRPALGRTQDTGMRVERPKVDDGGTFLRNGE